LLEVQLKIQGYSLGKKAEKTEAENGQGGTKLVSADGVDGETQVVADVDHALNFAVGTD